MKMGETKNKKKGQCRVQIQHLETMAIGFGHVIAGILSRSRVSSVFVKRALAPEQERLILPSSRS